MTSTSGQPRRAAPLYLYAIVEGRPRGALGVGIARKRLAVLRAGGAWVVVEALARDAEPTVATPATVAAHDRVVRRIARACPAALPLRFGTMVRGRAALETLLAPLAEPLRHGFDRVRGAVQYTLRVTGRASPLPAPRGAGPGTRWLAKRIAEQRVHEIAPLTEATKPFVRAVREERQARPDRLATAYHLVARADVRAWRTAVRRSLPSLSVGVSISGPWPAYAFAELA